ncbi:O-acetyl-ADP-ribose deacetylase MACROD2 [Liparis tanakae]|uniref:O-acetyl-ADP-ribose deacetylase MACROD2 n=1 Tax=Liparis tanakae TaxID=230148 RepID=A0A4Z2I9C8_9TELE|nr:O-acetyl-ADP-ribose deacetylase MACROD2 [Liparis tanakae]
MSKKKKDWKTEKERLLRLDREERRKEYRRQYFVSLDMISTWGEENRPNDKEEGDELTGGGGLSEKVSLYKGDITLLEVDAIVNAGTGLIRTHGIAVDFAAQFPYAITVLLNNSNALHLCGYKEILYLNQDEQGAATLSSDPTESPRRPGRVQVVNKGVAAWRGLHSVELSCCQSRWGLATADYHSFTRLLLALKKYSEITKRIQTVEDCLRLSSSKQMAEICSTLGDETSEMVQDKWTKREANHARQICGDRRWLCAVVESAGDPRMSSCPRVDLLLAAFSLLKANKATADDTADTIHSFSTTRRQ